MVKSKFMLGYDWNLDINVRRRTMFTAYGSDPGEAHNFPTAYCGALVISQVQVFSSSMLVKMNEDGAILINGIVAHHDCFSHAPRFRMKKNICAE